MSNTVAADKTDEEYLEFLDSPEDLSTKLDRLAEMIRKHKGRVVFYTGAGISTGAGIPDFRSGLGSVTGMPPGKWCLDATKSQWTEQERRDIAARRRRTTSALQAIPTPSHMALVALREAGVVLGLISQNCDGLHRRSGFDPDALAELHGNTNLEYCGWCGHEYLRDFRASTGRHTKGAEFTRTLWPKHRKLKGLINPRRGRHYTGRRCQVSGCGGYLFDSTIDFGDNLPENHINRGYKLAKKAGLCIVLGSRCSVSPACDMPISVGESGRDLVVVNLQRTAADPHAALRIGAKIDDVMVPLMQRLGVRIPEFKLTRTVCVALRPPAGADKSDGSGGAAAAGAPSGAARPSLVLAVSGVDADGLPVDLLWNVQARFHRRGGGGSVAAGGSSGHDDGAAAAPAGVLVKARVQLNQDARHRPLVPGDRGRVQTWPWENLKRPGYADVMFDSGAAAGQCFSVPAGNVEVMDGFTTPAGQEGVVVVDAASTHGPELAHEIPLPPVARGATLRRLTLMFRAHYGELPLDLPLPSARQLAAARAGTSVAVTRTLRYDVVHQQWAVERADGDGADEEEEDDEEDEEEQKVQDAAEESVGRRGDGAGAATVVAAPAGRGEHTEDVCAATAPAAAVGSGSGTAGVGGAVRLRIAAREAFNGGPAGDKYRCFHEVTVEAPPAARVAAVTFRTPGQGFRRDQLTVAAPRAFTMRYGPCWGRPHVTIDLRLADGSVREAVFEDNLPSASTELALAC